MLPFAVLQVFFLISGLIKFRKVLYLNYSIHFIYFDC